ncbi:MAG: SAM-dependent methyltransferase [Arcticibacterium sp.]|jgi:SAM-dependent methyltransferase
MNKSVNWQLNANLYFEWDVETWGRSMELWRDQLLEKQGGTALEIGGRRGGISMMLANDYAMNVVCSDLNDPETTASVIHKDAVNPSLITYRAIDCTNIDFQDDTFDLVIFKSVIGALGDKIKQQRAIDEMRRVLKKGGVLLFAENMEGSFFHMFLRKRFISWSSYWRYLHVKDVDVFFSAFENFRCNFTGCLAILTNQRIAKRWLSFVDAKLNGVIPKKMKYVVYGYARK